MNEAPPADARYSAALGLGLRGDYAAARAGMTALADGHRADSAGAWALYQAALAARAQGDTAGAAALGRRLAAEHPASFLISRLDARLDLTPQPRPEGTRLTGKGESLLASRWRDPVGEARCGPLALAHLLAAHSKPADPDALAKECGTGAHGTALDALEKAALRAGLRVECLRADAEWLRTERREGLAWVDGRHYVVFAPAAGGQSGREASVWDPADGSTRAESWDVLAKRSQGIVMAVSKG